MILIKQILNKLINFRLIRNIFKKMRGNFVILYYHGILNDDEFAKISGPNKHLFVSKSNFVKQMDFLEKNKIDVISIDELYNLNFKPLKFSVVISFDDGYRDNLDNVYPILKKKKFPFVIYLVSNLLKEEPWVWWIELWYQLQKKNNISIHNKKIDISTQTLKIKTFIELKKKIKKLIKKDQKEMIIKIFDLSETMNMKKYFLNVSEIKEISKDELVTLGSHSEDHLSLKKFDRNTIHKEIEKSKIYLEEIFNVSIKHFSYPYGQADDINFYEHKILCDLGYVTSVTTMDYSYKKFNQYYLNRCSIGPNVDENDFERKLLGIDKFFRKIFFK
jgi:peptidoglycan/xylan/chitin deacetylase (PgdA/CDA1 family)